MSKTWLSIVAAVCALACGEGEGTLVITAYGESFIEEGISAADMNDGWAVSFDRFEVSISDVRVAGLEIEVPASVDLAQPSDGAGHELGTASVAEGSYGDASFRIDRVEVEGTAVLGDEQKRLSWIFDAATEYAACDTRTTISNGGTGTFQITVHADHLFYDSLVAEDPQVLFQPVADADANADGDIARDELAAADIGSFDAGSDGGIDDLWAWLVAATQTLGHVDGEGHCDAAPVAD